MAEGMDEQQLVDFCHQLGLATDGYLNENDLSVVCRCIGLVAPEEMMKQLFEELDGDNDGRVCLAELSMMLRGMQMQPKNSSTPCSEKKLDENGLRSEKPLDLSPLTISEHCAFSILDPEHKGFAEVGLILDLWSQLGISPDVGAKILKELGFSTNSKLSINLQDLGRSIDDETDHSKETGLPPIFQAALITYRTEAQYLRSVCESMECEREKLKLDIAEAHQRSSMIAQEVDEQNARFERNNQMNLLKIESKYTEQIHAMQRSMAAEKETLQQQILVLESHLSHLHEEENKLKAQITSLKEENTQLESEVKSMSQEIKRVTGLKEKIEDEMSHYLELEKKLLEVEKQGLDRIAESELNLQRSHADIQSLKDQNDELSSQLEKMKESFNNAKTIEGRKFYMRRRRKKGPKRDDMKMDEDLSCVPKEKMGRFHQSFANSSGAIQNLQDADDAESSLEHAFLSCSSQGPDSGTFNGVINLADCVMDESCTEPQDTKVDAIEDQENSDNSEQTPPCNITETQETNKIRELEEQLEHMKVVFENEKKQLQTQCSSFEKSLELLQEEYEKCEDYWHGKLNEERSQFELDRNINDEKFYELSLKIKEYEEMCLQQNDTSNKLPPIEERASLEKQVTDLDDECNCLKEQLKSLLSEQDSIISTYQRNLELRTNEECTNLEQQVQALQVKCQEYETRLTSITEESSTVLAKDDESEVLRARVQVLENELRDQKDRHAEHVQYLERMWKRKASEKSSQGEARMNSVACQADPAKPKADLLHMLQTPQTSLWSKQPEYNSYQTEKTYSLPYIPATYSQGINNSGQWVPFTNSENWNPATTMINNSNQQPKKVWCHVEVAWLQALRNKLKQREDQCLMLQRALGSLEQQHEKVLSDIRIQHSTEISNWESLMQASQELVRQQVVKQKDQAEKLMRADSFVNDLSAENGKLVSALNSAQQRLIYLESLLKKSTNSYLFSNGPTNGDNSPPSSTSVSMQTSISNHSNSNSFAH